MSQIPQSPDITQRPEFQKTLLRAKEFYQVDRRLSVEDRKKLTSAFNAPLICDPLFSLPGLYLGIQLPNYAKKFQYLGPTRQTRGLSVVLGFFGLMVGGQLGTLVGYTYAESTLSSNANAAKAFNLMLLYPPQLGRAYYGETAKDPSKAMPNPDLINWRKEVMFPYNLVVHPSKQIDPSGPGGPAASQGRMPGQLPGRTPAPIPGRIPGPQPVATKIEEPVSIYGDPEEGDPFEDDNATPEEPEQVVSSWDRIRLHKGPADVPKAPPSSSYSSGAPGGISVLAAPSADEFDKELELERRGEGVPDDFSESERKWA